VVLFEVARDVVSDDNGDHNHRGGDGGLEKKRGMQVPKIKMKERGFFIFIVMCCHGMVLQYKNIFLIAFLRGQKNSSS